MARRIGDLSPFVANLRMASEERLSEIGERTTKIGIHSDAAA
jgi:hypothetical protein